MVFGYQIDKPHKPLGFVVTGIHLFAKELSKRVIASSQHLRSMQDGELSYTGDPSFFSGIAGA
jgi:hypothetical protein